MLDLNQQANNCKQLINCQSILLSTIFFHFLCCGAKGDESVATKLSSQRLFSGELERLANVGEQPVANLPCIIRSQHHNLAYFWSCVKHFMHFFTMKLRYWNLFLNNVISRGMDIPTSEVFIA